MRAGKFGTGGGERLRARMSQLSGRPFHFHGDLRTSRRGTSGVGTSFPERCLADRVPTDSNRGATFSTVPALFERCTFRLRKTGRNAFPFGPELVTAIH